MRPEPGLQRFLAGVVLLACLAAAPAAGAAWYQVEVIVFERLKPDADGELFRDNPGLPDRSASIDLLTELPPAEPGAEAPGAAPVRVPYLKLPEARYRLEGIYRVLRLSSEYRPLLHVAWQQPGEGPNAGRAVHLEAFADGGAQGAEFPSAMQPLLDGMVGLRVTRFLHAEVDMAYFPPASRLQGVPVSSAPPAAASQADYVRLTERRKILLNELHYFDHPLFGVILQVSRIQENE